MDTVKIGVLGAYRGRSMIDYCKHDKRAKLAAVCDIRQEYLDDVKRDIGGDTAYYTDFEKFLQSDIDAVVLANYANEHAPFAIRCLQSGKHVLSEVLPTQNLAEAVALVEAVEQSGKIYDYGENYCYMPAPREMKRLYEKGELGKFEYGEGEYLHNCEDGWPSITYGDPTHWRNNMSAFFYCTHSLGPILHITGLRPVKVTGFEMPFNERMARMGAKAGWGALEIVTLENGAIVKSLHGVGPSKDSVWFSVYGSLGTAEGRRPMANATPVFFSNLDYYEGENINRVLGYTPVDRYSEAAKATGHGGADFFVMRHFVDKILGNANADIIDVYEALSMSLPGLLAYRSVLNGGIPMEIPDLRDKKQRDKYRNDTACTDPKAAGKQLLPSYSKGNPDVPQAVYDKAKAAYEQTRTDQKA